MFRGNAPARIDDKGRLKIPTGFRALLETKYGRELFLTSLSGEYVRVYPMPVLDVTAASVDNIVNNYTAAVQSAADVALSN